MNIKWLDPQPPDGPDANETPFAIRLAWFVGIASVSAIVVISLAYLLRAALFI